VESEITIMQLFTIGHQGRRREDLLALLRAHGVRTVVDIRLCPEQPGRGNWARAKTPDKGIEGWLAAAGIGYRSLTELGNPFAGLPDWRERYQRLINVAGALLTERLRDLSGPICLLSRERRAAECHRGEVAAYLEARDATVQHLE